MSRIRKNKNIFLAESEISPKTIKTAPETNENEKDELVITKDKQMKIKGYPERKNDFIDKVRKKYQDKDFIWLLLAENGALTIDRKSDIGYRRNGKLYFDYWFCQVSEYYHPKIVNDERFFTDEDWQLEQCRQLYKGGTVFYWYAHRHKFVRLLVLE